MEQKATTISVRIEAGMKKEFEAVCSKMGMTPSAALTVFMTRVIRDQCIPFDITASTSARVR